MTGDSELPRLCRLIDGSLRPYVELDGFSVRLTKENEQNLLIALSKVYRDIQAWIRELEADSDEETTVSECSVEVVHEEHDCLTEVLADLIPLLTIDSQFINHSVGKILIAISEFVDLSGSKWDSLIDSLCLCLVWILNRPLSCSLSPSSAGNLHLDSSVLVALNRGLGCADWSTAGHIIKILRNILKCLKQESDDEHLQTYEKSVHFFLSNVPWVCMDEICAKETKAVFLGSLIPFLCSLVEQITVTETRFHLQDQHSTLSIVINLVPKLLCWCVGKRDTVKQSASLYFTHKLLMLMLRLSYRTHLSCTILISWLQLLHDYFEELLFKPINMVKPGHYDSLEGSPFLSSLSEGEANDMHFHHSQRQAILLFLRCCFSLTSLAGGSINQCPSTDNSSSTIDLVSELDSSNRTRGFMELYIWIQRHLQDGFSTEKEVCMDNYIIFAGSFLQLYLHEDDLLFKVLLQLVCVSSCLEQQSEVVKHTCHDAEGEIGYFVSNVFNPVKLFHIFLSELHYDHQVLLDYLISKDLGTSCAEYLLRCLRAICSSWHLFIEFSIEGKASDNLSLKKQKILSDGSDFRAEQSSSVLIEDVPPSREKLRIEPGFSFKPRETIRNRFINAKDCLLSLKVSIENLQQKNLFPYNPKVLLNRLAKFEELCFSKESSNFS